MGFGTKRLTRDPFLPDGVDPYRTQYGTFVTRQVLSAGVMIALVLTLGLAVSGLFLARGIVPATEWIVAAPLIAVVLIVLGFVVLLVVLFRRRRS